MNKLIGTQVPINSLNSNDQNTLKDGKLIFVETLTVEQFRDEEKVSEVLVRKNPHTGKLFFTYGSKSGMASKEVPEHPMISHVITQAKDRQGNIIPGMAQHAYMLHNEATSGAEVVARF